MDLCLVVGTCSLPYILYSVPMHLLATVLAAVMEASGNAIVFLFHIVVRLRKRRSLVVLSRSGEETQRE